MLYAIVHVIIYRLARLFFRLKVIGHENIPKNGGVIIASNHISYLDIPIIGCSMERKGDFFGKSELFRNPIIGRLFRILGGISVKRGRPDKEAISETLNRLKRGRLVIIYPEGGRGHNDRLRNPKPGIGMISAMSHAPVVPAYIKGTDKALPIGAKWIRLTPIIVIFGKPLKSFSHINEEKAKERYIKISKEIMDRVGYLKETIDKETANSTKKQR
ncbi:MAG: lysophospholipid acyltransferase family protein [Nitrospirota bacterium]